MATYEERIKKVEVNVHEVHEAIHWLKVEMQSANARSQGMEASLKEIMGILMNNRGQPKKILVLN